jgi:DNA-binding CsgD family transcriptional regulator
MSGAVAVFPIAGPQAPDGAVLAALLDQVDHGVAVVSADGTTVYANRQAALWGEACGLRVGLHDVLRVACAAETRQLRHLVRVACGGGPAGSLRLTAPSGLSGLAARVSALHVGPAPGLAMVMLRRLGGEPAMDTARLMDMFGLTRAEAAILPALIAGETTSAVARALGLSTHTVRTHVRAVLAKTQAAILRALAMLVSSAIGG